MITKSSEYLWLQILLFLLQNIMYIIYLIYTRPLSEGIEIEISNEIFTLALSYFMIIYTDFVSG